MQGRSQEGGGGGGEEVAQTVNNNITTCQSGAALKIAARPRLNLKKNYHWKRPMYGGFILLPHPFLVEYNSASIWMSNFDYQLIVTITKYERMTVTNFYGFLFS